MFKLKSLVDFFIPKLMLDSGGGGSTTSGGTSVSELPEWARGYAKETLARGAALTDINQNPYQTYGQSRLAGFSPMQQQAMQGAANIQTGPEAFQRGVTGYMNPYIEQALKPQIAEANRAYDISGQRQQGQATQAGAFGGSRDAIMRAENERNRNMGIQNIVGQGYNTAFQNAQNQYNTGFNQNILANQLQSQYGAQQQAQAQKGLDIGYQDFLNQQNYPYKQLGFMSDLIRGMPLGQATTRSMYEPAPGLAQQIGSVGLGAYGISKFMADGGMAYADGGEVQGYAGDDGSFVEDVDSRDKLTEYAHRLKTDADLQKSLQLAKARNDVDQVEAVQKEMGLRASLRRGLAGGITNKMADRMAGGGVVAFAGGGINDYMDTLTKLGKEDISQTPEQMEAGISAAMPAIEARYGKSALAPYMEDVKKERASLSKMSDEGVGLGALAASQALLRPGSASRAIAGAMGAFGQEVIKMKKEQREADRLLRQSEISLATAEQARADGLKGKAEAMYDKSRAQEKEGLERQINVTEKQAQIQAGIDNSKRQAAASMASVNKPSERERLLTQMDEIESGKRTFQGKTGKEGAEAFMKANADLGAAMYGVKYTGQDKTLDRLATALKNDKEYPMLQLQRVQLAASKDPKAQAEVARIDARLEEIRAREKANLEGAGREGGGGGLTPPPAAVEFLKANPDARRDFDAKYGAGAADRYLGK